MKVDSQHYKVTFENDHVRVLRISYGPYEKSVMQEHPAGVVVVMSDDQRWLMTLPDGTTEEPRRPSLAGAISRLRPATSGGAAPGAA